MKHFISLLQMTLIKLLLCDGETVETELETAKYLGPIRDMLDALPDSNDTESVKLENVDSETLQKVLEWVNYHKDDPLTDLPEEERELRSDDICQWDQNFLKVDLGTLLRLLEVSNYLDIKGLVEITSKSLANMIRGKNSDQIRETFFIAEQNAAD